MIAGGRGVFEIHDMLCTLLDVFCALHSCGPCLAFLLTVSGLIIDTIDLSKHRKNTCSATTVCKEEGVNNNLITDKSVHTNKMPDYSRFEFHSL